MTTRIITIMAGGVGERFWPVSRRARPKQLLKLDGERTMIAEAVERIAPLVPPERILIATSEPLLGAMREALPNIPSENVIGEPSKRHTTGCVTWAALSARRFGPPEEVVMGVLTADHAIGEWPNFRESVDEALTFAEENDALVTFGVEPTRPETGYGYIELGALERETSVGPLHRIATFREKPDATTATQYVAGGNHLWNSGMFFWRLSSLAAGFKRYAPEYAAGLSQMTLLRNQGDEDGVRASFEALPSISVDHALMEPADNTYTLRVSFPWDDVGEWSALARHGAADAAGNFVTGEGILDDCRDCIVYNEAQGATRIVGGVGLEGLVIVTTDDAVMVVPRERAQDVRRIVAELKRRKLDRHL